MTLRHVLCSCLYELIMIHVIKLLVIINLIQIAYALTQVCSWIKKLPVSYPFGCYKRWITAEYNRVCVRACVYVCARAYALRWLCYTYSTLIYSKQFVHNIFMWHWIVFTFVCALIFQQLVKFILENDLVIVFVETTIYLPRLPTILPGLLINEWL